MDWKQVNERFVNPAVSAWRAGKIREADTIFKQGLAATGNDGYVALSYAHFLEGCGRLKEAEEMFEIALERLPILEFKEKAKVGLERVTRRFGVSAPHVMATGTQPSHSDSRKKYPAEYRTEDGRWVRSKSEKIIADWLYNNRVRFEYERKVVEGVTCDFYLPDMDVYIEFWGIDNEAYRRYRRKKEEVYSKLGLRLFSLNDADLKHIDDVLRSKLKQPATPLRSEPAVLDFSTTISRAPAPSKDKWLNPTDPNVVSYLDAGKYVGHIKTVEGRIVSTNKSAKNTIFLNFHKPTKQFFSGSILITVIFGKDIKKFPFDPETFYRGKEVRVTGRIEHYGTDQRIVVRAPSQVEVSSRDDSSLYLSQKAEIDVGSDLSRDTMKLNPVGQVSLGAKSIKVILNLKEIDHAAASGGIATFYVNLEYLKQVLDGKLTATQIAQLVPK